MPIIADNKGEFEKPPLGLNNAVCYNVVDLGMQEDTYKGVKSTKHKIMILWELEEVQKEGEYAGERHLVFKEYTKSLGDKANLRKDMRSWRGKDFNEEELQGFDVEKVISKRVTLSLALNKNQNVFVDALAMPQATNELVAKKLGYIPDWIKKKVNASTDGEFYDGPEDEPDLPPENEIIEAGPETDLMF